MSGFQRPTTRSPLTPSIPIYPTTALPDRLPPQNLEAERSLLGSILLDDTVMPEVLEVLDVPDLYRDVHQAVFQAMRDLFEKGQPIDAVTLAEELTRQGLFEQLGADDLLEELVEAVRHSANARYYAGIVREKADMRRVVETLCEGIHKSYSNELTAGEVLDFVVRKITAARVEESRKEDPSIHLAPDRMGEKAFHGLLGQIVEIASPQTEACREAILGQLLVALGNVIGPRPHWRVDATVHRCNLFLCLVGPTGVARKGTSWDIAKWLVARCEPEWDASSSGGGLASGEGLIDRVRVADGPVLAVETEFARLLTNANREHSSLSAVIRQAWDGPVMAVVTKNNPIFVDNAFVSIIGHMTASDLRAKLRANDLENGMANRFLWVHVYRDGLLPEGGDFDSVTQVLGPLVPELQRAVDFARADSAFRNPMPKTVKAKEYWREFYHGPLNAIRTGKYASLTVRAAPMILRMAVIYAILDRSRMLDVPHIEAARAFWDYCDQTVAHLWGDPQLDSELRKVMETLKAIPAGLTKGELNRKAFAGHARAAKLDELIAQAQGTGLVVRGERKTSGGSKTLWIYREPSKE